MMHVDTARGLWAALHRYSQKSEREQRIDFHFWLIEVESTIGCETCFRKLQWFLKMWPVEFGEHFWLWSICLHDFVNKQLGRKLFYPDLTVEPLTAKGIFQ